MTTKHTPATPLPYWMSKTLVGDVVKYAIGSGDKEIGVYDRREDALFAYYAANAYPKLVERTKQRAAFLRLIAGRIPPPLQQMIQEALNSECASDEALLRELGESQ